MTGLQLAGLLCAAALALTQGGCGRTGPGAAPADPAPDSASAPADRPDPSAAPAEDQREEEGIMYLQLGDVLWTATLEDNPSAQAWRELLEQGPLTVRLSDFGGFEKVGELGTTLPRSDSQITTRPGDIILYLGSNVTIYYGENTWNFTRLGHIDGVADDQLRQVLKAGGEDVTVTFSLTAPQ